jgi:hypothetical protein
MCYTSAQIVSTVVACNQSYTKNHVQCLAYAYTLRGHEFEHWYYHQLRQSLPHRLLAIKIQYCYKRVVVLWRLLVDDHQYLAPFSIVQI